MVHNRDTHHVELFRGIPEEGDFKSPPLDASIQTLEPSVLRILRLKNLTLQAREDSP
jgi:hypothetical protein